MRTKLRVFGWVGVCLARTSVWALFPVGITDIAEDPEWLESLSRSGQKALAIEGMNWNHAMSEHFIYHFQKRWMAERAGAEAETYYEQIKKDFKISQDRWQKKEHLFLFESEPAWKDFIGKVGVDRWSGGVCLGDEIYLLSPPGAQPFTGQAIAHEITHLVVNRFVKGRLPIWLSEGVAEQQARKHFVAYTKPKGFNFLLPPNVVSEKNYIPIADLVAARDYPEDATKVSSFYTESVRLVQFLMENHVEQDFLKFLQNMADEQTFESSFDEVYGQQYRDRTALEEAFREVAISKTKLTESEEQKTTD